MANTTFKLRRSSVSGKSPNTSTLSIGELAINLTDRKLYSSDGTNIFETGSNLTSLAVFSSIVIGNSTVNTTVNSTAFSGTSNAATYVIANSGITSNASGVFVTQGTGVVVNATGVHVNSAYINTISSEYNIPKRELLDIWKRRDKPKVLTEDLGKIFEKAICNLYEIEYDGKYNYSLEEAEKIKQKIFKKLNHQKQASFSFASFNETWKNLTLRFCPFSKLFCRLSGVGRVY